MKKLLLLLTITACGLDTPGENEALSQPPDRVVLNPVRINQDHTITIRSDEYQAIAEYMKQSASWMRSAQEHLRTCDLEPTN